MFSFLTLPVQFSSCAEISLSRNLKTIQSTFQTFHNQIANSSLASSVFPDRLFFLQLNFRFLSSASVSLFDLGWKENSFISLSLPRKEVIQPHLPIRLPCYDFTPVIGLTLDGCLLAVSSPASGAPNSHGVTGGVYKARERIHRGILIRDY